MAVCVKTGLDPGKLLLARRKFLKEQQKKIQQQAKQEQAEETRSRKLSSLVTMKSQVRGQGQGCFIVKRIMVIGF